MKKKTQTGVSVANNEADSSAGRFTPGPWHLMKGPYNNGYELKVCPVNRQTSAYFMVGGDRRESNACLIAAAPELLACLKLAIDEVDFPKSIRECFENTIAKAEGKTASPKTTSGSEGRE